MGDDRILRPWLQIRAADGRGDGRGPWPARSCPAPSAAGPPATRTEKARRRTVSSRMAIGRDHRLHRTDDRIADQNHCDPSGHGAGLRARAVVVVDPWRPLRRDTCWAGQRPVLDRVVALAAVGLALAIWTMRLFLRVGQGYAGAVGSAETALVGARSLPARPQSDDLQRPHDARGRGPGPRLLAGGGGLDARLFSSSTRSTSR